MKRRLIVTAEIEVDDDEFAIGDMQQYEERDAMIKHILSEGVNTTNVIMAVTETTECPDWGIWFGKQIDSHIVELSDYRKSGTNPLWESQKVAHNATCTY